jgi:acyl-lipid omega-6 desaturase (Delta-12 desaturase)
MMRTRKELLTATIPFAQEVRWKSWWHLGTTIVVLAALLLVVCSETSWLIRAPFSIALGLVLVRFFVLYHDHQHGAILGNSLLATTIMRIYGISVLNPPSVWNRSHDHHHTHNSKTLIPNVGSFPVMTVEAYHNATRWQRLQYLVRRHFLTIALGYITVFLIGMCIGPLLANPRRHLDAGLSMLCHTGILLWFGLDETDDLWMAALVPFAIASAVGAMIFFMQHNFPGAKFQTGQKWDYVVAALQSSSYIRMNPLFRWLTGNIGYHHVHHLNARIPFYRLPDAMAAIDELQTPTMISLSPASIRNCFRLSLLDATRGELVSRGAAAATAP